MPRHDATQDSCGSMSPNVAAGVALLDTIALRSPFSSAHQDGNCSSASSDLSAGGENGEGDHVRTSCEDMELQNRILHSRAHGDRIAKERAEEDLKYARHQLQQRDRAIEAMREGQQKQHALVASLRRQLEERECALVSLRGAHNELAQQVTFLQGENVRLRDELRRKAKEASAATPATPSGGRSFAEMHKDKVTIIRLKRAVAEVREAQERKSAALEHDLMALHDKYVPCYVTVQAVEEARAEHSGASVADDIDWERRFGGQPKLITYDALRRAGRRGVLPFEEKLDLRMPEDTYIAAKVGKSAFAGTIAPLRSELTRIAHDWKAFMDTTLSSLWYIFQEHEKRGKSVLANPRDDFMKEVGGTLKKTKSMLFSMMKVVNSTVKDVLNSENAVKVMWVRQARPSADAECQADIPPPEDPRIAELSDRVAFLTERISVIQEDRVAAIEALELQKEKAEVNTQFLQNKVFALHQAVYTALHAVYKHRFHWIRRLPNHFADIDTNASRRKQLEVRYNVDVARAIDGDVKLLHRFTDYFVSDESFGVDLSGARASEKGNPRSTQGQQPGGASIVSGAARRKEAVPTKRRIDAARRLSSEVDTMLQRELRVDEDGGTSSRNGPAHLAARAEVNVDPAAAAAFGGSGGPQPQPPAGAPLVTGADCGVTRGKRRASHTSTPTTPIPGMMVAVSSTQPRATSSTPDQQQHRAAPPERADGNAGSAAFTEALTAGASCGEGATGLHRMESWQRRQHALWEAKKARQFGGASTMMLQLAVDGETCGDTGFGSFENNRPPIALRRALQPGTLLPQQPQALPRRPSKA